tara:strand:- start:11 stop:469 length:459 start_codon:yes stop_codon:yes gene_type:complete
MTIRKRFDPVLYQVADRDAKAATLGWLKALKFTTVDTTERKDFDIICKSVEEKRHLYEVEIKYSWKGEWPDHWEEIRIPHRKQRLINKWIEECSEDPFTFIIFRNDCQKAWHIDAKTLLTCDVKEAKNRYTGSRGEKFFHIPVKEASLVDMV